MRVIIDRVIVNRSLNTLFVLLATVFVLLLFEAVLWICSSIFDAAIVTRVDGRMSLYILGREYLNFRWTTLSTIQLGASSLNSIRSGYTSIFETRFFIALVDIVLIILLVPVTLIIECTWHF